MNFITRAFSSFWSVPPKIILWFAVCDLFWCNEIILCINDQETTYHNNHTIWLWSQSSDDEEKRFKRREKNRVAAQRSRKKQTQRADELHEVCKLHII